MSTYDNLIRVNKHSLASLTASLAMLITAHDKMNDEIKRIITTKTTETYGAKEIIELIFDTRKEFKLTRDGISKKLSTTQAELFNIRITAEQFDETILQVKEASTKLDSDLKVNVELIDGLRIEKLRAEEEIKTLKEEIQTLTIRAQDNSSTPPHANTGGEATHEQENRASRGSDNRSYKLDPKAPIFSSTNSDNITEWIADIEIYLNLATVPDILRHQVVQV